MPTSKESIKARRILIVDDHPMICDGIAALAEHEPDVAVCGEAEDIPHALKAIEKLQPDIVIVDISLKGSNGIELIKYIRVRWPKLPVLVFSMRGESFFAERALKAGARGYVSKRDPPTKVIEAVRHLLDTSGVYVSEKIASQIFSKLVPGSNLSQIDDLSKREYEVFELIGRGLRTREVAEKLHISVKTVETHRERIKTKLKLSGATDLVRYAVQWVQAGGAP